MRFKEATALIPKDVIVLEVGPSGVLRSPLRQSRPDLPYVVAMQRGGDAAVSVPDAVCQLWCKGAPINWPAEAPSAAAASERAICHFAMAITHPAVCRCTWGQTSVLVSWSSIWCIGKLSAIKPSLAHQHGGGRQRLQSAMYGSVDLVKLCAMQCPLRWRMHW